RALCRARGEAALMGSPRVNVLGTGISPISMPTALSQIDDWIQSRARQYVCVCTVHTVMQCRRSDALRRLVNASGMNTPDGMPLVWLSRMAGYPDVTRVYGPDLMLADMEHGQPAGRAHMAVAAVVLVLLLVAIYAPAVWQIVRSPLRALGVLVAGMAFHNFLIMVLLAQRTPAPVVRIVQSSKEGLLLLLSLMAAAAFIRAWRAGHLPRPNLFDLLVAV